MKRMKQLWKTLKNKVTRFDRDERGIEGIEYLLIAALVIIAAASAWKFLGKTISNNVNNMANGITATVDESMETGGMKGK